jgi:spore maturation protein SpmA
MNGILLAMVSVAFVFAGWRQFAWIPVEGGSAPMELLSKAMIEAASGAVTLAIGLVGVMTLFMGLMKVAEAGGMLRIIARLIRPLMVRLFPDVPPEHPAMGAMILNLSANALGLGNARPRRSASGPCRSWTNSTASQARPPTPWCSSWPSTPPRSLFCPPA